MRVFREERLVRFRGQGSVVRFTNDSFTGDLRRCMSDNGSRKSAPVANHQRASPSRQARNENNVKSLTVVRQ